MKNKIENVKDWFNTRGIIKNSTPLKQSLKTSEEVLELQNAIVDKDMEGIKDAIGDTQVTLIGVCMHFELDYFELFNKAIDNQDNNTLVDIFLYSLALESSTTHLKESIKDDSDSKAIAMHILVIIDLLNDCARTQNLTLEECLQSAYDVISKRTGKVINGQFVKELSNTERGDGGFGSTGK